MNRAGHNAKAINHGCEFLTAQEVGHRLRLPLSTVYYLAKSGRLPAVRFGRAWRFPADRIDRLTKENRLPQVLVVDGDSVTRELVSDYLSSQGFQVQQASGVDQALRLARGHPFDVLLVDLILPGRSGTELIQELKGEYSLNQMIVITSFPEGAQVERLLELGAITLLRKPLSVDQLCACVEGTIRARRSAGPTELNHAHSIPAQHFLK